MRTTNFLMTIAATGTLFLASCGTSTEQTNQAEPNQEAVTAEPITKDVDAAASSVKWVGKMIGIKAHDGTVALQEGSVTLAGKNVTGGNFVVNMGSITPLDDAYTPPGSEKGTREMLVGHLASDDFFAIEQYPTATFEITGANEDGSVSGNLTVRGKTNQETVTDVVVDEANGTVSGTLVFDRKKYDVAWDAPMKDAILSNDIELQIELKIAG